MSHFTMLVATPSRPDEAMLDKIMAPWHEFECAGVDDKYVIDVDETDEVRKEYEEKTTRRLRDPQGVLHDPHLDRFYRELTPEEIGASGRLAGSGSITMPDGSRLLYSSGHWKDGKGYRAKAQVIPSDHEDVEVPVKDVQTFAEWVKDWYGRTPLVHGQSPTDDHKYGYTQLDENGDVVKVINRTNPNAEWDWYLVGGRWSGTLQLKHPELDGVVGRPGSLGSTSGRGGVDSCRVGDLSLDRMREENLNERKDRVKGAVDKVLEKNPALTREEVIAMTEARALAVASLTEAWEAEGRPGRLWEWISDQDCDETSCVHRTDRISSMFDYFGGLDYAHIASAGSVEKWVRSAIPLMTYGFVTLDGKWCSRGDMGWFGISSNETEEADYHKAYLEFFEGLPKDAWVTVVDCHI